MNEKEIRKIIDDYVVEKIKKQEDKLNILKARIKREEDYLIQLKEKYKHTPSMLKEYFEYDTSDNITAYLKYNIQKIKEHINHIKESINNDFIENLVYFCNMFPDEYELISQLFIEARVEIFEYENSSIDKKKSKKYIKQTMLKKANSIQLFSTYPINLEIPTYKDETIKNFMCGVKIFKSRLKQENNKKILMCFKDDDFFKAAISLISKNIKLPKNYKQHTEAKVIWKKDYLNTINEIIE